MSRELTMRQQHVLDVLRDFIEENGIAPTHAELARLLDVSSTKAAADHLKALAKKGAIRLHSEKTRGIQILASEVDELPLLGSVAAGLPIEAVENIERYVTIPEILRRKKPTFLLRVRGDSMKDAGILDGDLIAVRKSQTADIGQIVVARIEDEVTVKRLGKENGNPVLYPENSDFQPIEVAPDQLIIEGQFVGLIRA
ncbi:transcriptional repressor LexA [Pleionea sp. CnH1-48]|uniref:transcriptional repressor LexA n=1 Tax=Pleionea sp. CnH1-48 TaxID=2954494 RepID=UPI0020970FB6|nr:transcriptional repressor LexA [Pleionea sp. CnH1-48]MCO7225312.1 transcriptional repressor LexA [Pleionea sp. CnH1-48]